VSKKRGFRQRVGRRGEDAFRPFSSRHGLMSTKVEEDVGFDFLCHVEEEGTEDLREVAGSVLGISVRSSSQKNPRVRLDRSDAEAMLRANFVVCLALVAVTPKSETVYYRFVEESFARELANFLTSDQKSISLTPGDCRDESTFERDLRAALKGNTPEKVKIAVAAHRVQRLLPDAELRIVRTATDELTVVEVADFYDYFVRGETPQTDDVHAAIFGSPRLRMERLAQLGPRPDFNGEFARLPEALLVGGTWESDIRVRVIDPTGDATEAFSTVRTRTHHGWVHPAGFSISFSQRIQKGGVWVHDITALIDEGEELLSDAEPALWAFLEHCSEAATLSVVGEQRGGIEASYVANLDRAHFMAQYVRAASRLAGWDPVVAPLRLALDDESMHTLAVLAGIASDAGLLNNFGFVLDVGPAAAAQDRSSASLVFDEHTERLRLPVVGNLGELAAVVWLDAEVRYHRDTGGQVDGIRIERVLEARVEVRARLPKASLYPELMVDSTWPTVAFERGGPAQTDSDTSGWHLRAESLEPGSEAPAPGDS
jgi:hypothetical protein